MENILEEFGSCLVAIIMGSFVVGLFVKVLIGM
jgi:hypothetical protein